VAPTDRKEAGHEIVLAAVTAFNRIRSFCPFTGVPVGAETDILVAKAVTSAISTAVQSIIKFGVVV